MERRYDDYDYMADTWDAMTDGMYGDMPEGFDGDFDFLGWRRIDAYSPSALGIEAASFAERSGKWDSGTGIWDFGDFFWAGRNEAEQR